MSKNRYEYRDREEGLHHTNRDLETTRQWGHGNTRILPSESSEDTYLHVKQPVLPFDLGVREVLGAILPTARRQW